MTLTATLQAFESAVRAAGVPFTDLLAPPAPADEITRTIASLGLQPIGDIQALFSWHNGLLPGSSGIAELSIIPAHGSPISLAQALQAYGDINDPRRPPLLAPGWFPVLYLIGPAYLMMCCDPTYGQLGAVETFDWHSGSPEDPGVHSLEEVVTWWTRHIDAGEYIWDSQEELWTLVRPWLTLPGDERESGLVY